MRIICLLAIAALLVACEFQEKADQMFGDQHFKTAIALIELHKTRYGEYPRTLDDLRFVGEWDRNALSAVSYEKADDGYLLTISRGWLSEPELDYPEEFWQGLGIRNTGDIVD